MRSLGPGPVPLLLVVFIGVLEALQCPTGCTCSTKVTCRLNGSEITAVPQDLPAGLEELSISRSGIRVIRSGDLRRYINLTRLRFESNSKLTTLQPYFLQSLSNLTHFFCLNNSALTRLDRFAFAGIRAQLVKIYLEHNRIGEIAAHAFQNSRGIRNLSLDGNPIKKISKNAFTGLYMADFLYLPSGIEVIEADAFKNLTRVHDFDLKEPRLKSLDTHTFRGLKSVRKLTIRGGQIGVWHSSAFGGIETVKEIRVVDNRIRKLKRRAFAAMKNVGLLVMEGNRIKRLDRRVFRQSSMDRIRMENNKIVCSCHNMWLLKAENNNKTSLPPDFLRNNYCDSPRELNKRALNGIPYSYLENCLNKKGPENEFFEIDSNTSAGTSSHIPPSFSAFFPLITFCIAAR